MKTCTRGCRPRGARTLAIRVFPLTLAAAAWIALVSPASAQDDASSRAQAQREPGTGATWDNRPTFLLGEHGRIEIHARLQTDYLLRNEADPDAAALPFQDRLSVARKRVGV